MKYFSFILLSQADKLKEVWKNGTLIAERNDRTHHYELYQVENFYVEKQSEFSGRKLQISKTFKSVYYLDPYLEDIDTSSLYSS